MKNKLLLPCILVSLFFLKANGQNADEMIFNQYSPQFDYIAGSFVIDTGISRVNNQKRAFLIWANNFKKDSVSRNLSLSEYDGNLNFLTEQGGSDEKWGSVKTMFPKKIIKSKYDHVYYLLSYTTYSTHTITGIKVYSSPVVYKIDGNTLNPIWISKINTAGLTPANANKVIEYNDMIETRDKNIVLVGKYADTVISKEYVLSTKLKRNSGAILWQFLYMTSNQCNEGATTVAETTDGNLSVAGYVRKCVTGQTLNGNTDLFYLQLLPTGVPVPGVYERFFWPAGLNIWGDKISCYSSTPGNDQLIISGYIDLQNTTGGIDRQILVMNIRENGTLITSQHIGGPKNDICNDLIIKKHNSTANDFLIYLTGQTENVPVNTPPQAYYMSAKFNAATGVTAVTETSTFPNTLYTNGSRNGLEIKNAGNYKKFAVLATGYYQPIPRGTTQTYSDVLVRDLNDNTGSCIKQINMPLKQFSIDHNFKIIDFKNPQLKKYNDKWKALKKLYVKEPCQHISVDPYQALNFVQPGLSESTAFAQILKVSPNPAQSYITLATNDGSNLSGMNSTALIQILNYTMQVQKKFTIKSTQGSSIKLPVSGLTPGIYWIQVTRGNQKLSCSFMKE